MGAYAKSGASPISGLIKPGDIPPRGGLYLLDVVPDGEVRFGFPNINDNAEIAELIACGAHVVLFVTGPRLGRRLGDLAGGQDLRQSRDLSAHGGRHGCRCRPHPRRPRRLRRGRARKSATSWSVSPLAARTKSEALGHQEFILTYKSFEPIGPACLPAA